MSDENPDAPHLDLKRFWHKTFDEKFKEFKDDKWTLEPTNTKINGRGWHSFQDKAKVKFSCDECGKSWTSMKGRVIFWYRLNRERNEGSLRFKLFRQKCMRDTGEFQDPKWYREEIEKVLSNVYQKIGEEYYNFERSNQNERQRHGQPRRPHNKSMCEACHMGVCSKTQSHK